MGAIGCERKGCNNTDVGYRIDNTNGYICKACTNELNITLAYELQNFIKTFIGSELSDGSVNVGKINVPKLPKYPTLIPEDIQKLKDRTTLGKEWINRPEVKPTKIALWISRGDFMVMGIFWHDGVTGVWDDENAISVAKLILDIQ